MVGHMPGTAGKIQARLFGLVNDAEKGQSYQVVRLTETEGEIVVAISGAEAKVKEVAGNPTILFCQERFYLLLPAAQRSLVHQMFEPTIPSSRRQRRYPGWCQCGARRRYESKQCLAVTASLNQSHRFVQNASSVSLEDRDTGYNWVVTAVTGQD